MAEWVSLLSKPISEAEEGRGGPTKMAIDHASPMAMSPGDSVYLTFEQNDGGRGGLEVPPIFRKINVFI